MPSEARRAWGQQPDGRPSQPAAYPLDSTPRTCYKPRFLQGTHMGRAMKRLWPPQTANPLAQTRIEET